MTYHRSYASHTRVLIALLISVCAGCGDSSNKKAGQVRF